MYHDERVASLTNCPSCLPSVPRNLSITTKAARGKVLPCDLLSSLLRDLFTARRAFAFLPFSLRSQESNIKRDRPERTSPSPSATPRRRESREYFAMLIAKWTLRSTFRVRAPANVFILCSPLAVDFVLV